MFLSSNKIATRKFLKEKNRGFSIIELLVTLSIVVLATGLVMVKYASFNSSVLLNSQAYLLAFDLRETQSLAVSVRGSGTQFRQEYGLYFDYDTPNQYLLFLDANDQTPVRYNEGEEIGEPNVIDPRFIITDICGTTVAGVEQCQSTDGVPSTLSVAFARPDFDAVIYAEGMGLLNEAIITIASDNDTNFTKAIEVSAAGQISVE